MNEELETSVTSAETTPDTPESPFPPVPSESTFPQEDIAPQTTTETPMGATALPEHADEPYATVPATRVERARAWLSQHPLEATMATALVITGLFILGAAASTINQTSGSQKQVAVVASASPTADSDRSEPSPSPEISPTPALGSSPSPQPSATPSPSPKPTPTPTPSPSPSPVAKANLYFEGQPQIIVKRIEKAFEKDLPNGHVSNGNGKTFYYRYGDAMSTTDQTFSQGTHITLRAEIKNSEPVRTSEANFEVKAQRSDSSTVSMDFTIPVLNKSESKVITYAPDTFFSPSLFSISMKIDTRNQVAESVESDNLFERSLTITPDTTIPYLEIYSNTVQQTGNQICYDLRAMFTRDDQDAREGSEASTRTQVRFKMQHSSDFTGWIDYKSIGSTFPNPECVSATPGQAYAVLVESRDQSGNIATLSKSITAQ